jgi:hypothetical protein
MKIDATEIIRFFTFVLLVVFLWLGLQAYGYMSNYETAVKYVDAQYKAAYANLSCCVCQGNIYDIKPLENPFSKNVSVIG